MCIYKNMLENNEKLNNCHVIHKDFKILYGKMYSIWFSICFICPFYTELFG